MTDKATSEAVEAIRTEVCCSCYKECAEKVSDCGTLKVIDLRLKAYRNSILEEAIEAIKGSAASTIYETILAIEQLKEAK